MIKRHIECFGWFMVSPIRWGVEWILKKRKMVVLYRVWGTGIGDTLSMTTVLNWLHHKKKVQGIVFSKVSALFENNPQVVLHLNYSTMPKLLRSLLKTSFKYLRGDCVICVGQEKWVLGTLPWREYVPDCKGRSSFAIGDLVPDWSGPLDLLEKALPYLVFSEEELRTYGERYQQLPAEFGIVKASGGTSRSSGMVLKNWSIEGMQSVVLEPDASPYPWIQIGDKNEPALNGVINLLGKTSLRETCFLISRAKVVLSTEGFISHVAAAFERPMVIVFSGYHDYESYHYPSARKVLADPMPVCAPCYLNSCITPGKPCTSTISVNQVVSEVRQALVNN